MPNPTETDLGLPWAKAYHDGSGPEYITACNGTLPVLVMGLHGDPEIRGELTPRENKQQNFILRAANNHHALLAALKLARYRIQMAEGTYSGLCPPVGTDTKIDATIDAAILAAEKE